MKIVKVDDTHRHVYANLYQGYAAEFSKIIDDKPNPDGTFDIDPKPEGSVTGYLLYLEGIPAALTAIDEKTPKGYEICDFYVLPCFRNKKVGKRFISILFQRLGGAWEIKQVAGAEHALKFWREVVGDYTDGHYIEDVFEDAKWGTVTRQRFHHDKRAQ
ncbi:GNAT family N-acetyltransferase [Motilimonas pumila]|uniref:GNAT family N-acetyltransferase n=1 Tax=Motilimonas pumila TaxID=2303987 RepID=A0A418Y9A3_9GAMM|nr:hypothetical protein [Motilimonas pumila]RJG36865.1 hypothetical protein D1Z90_20145 [Motilimonas pumila]